MFHRRHFAQLFRIVLLSGLCFPFSAPTLSAQPQDPATVHTSSDQIGPGVVSINGPITLDTAVVGTRAYLAQRRALTILDISNPDAPTVISNTPWLRGIGEGIAATSEFVYFLTSGRELQVMDVRDPHHPVARGSVEVPGHSYGLSVHGSLVFMVTAHEVYRGGYKASATMLQIVDVSNPDQPRLRGHGGDNFCFAGFVRVRGTIAYFLCPNEKDQEVGSLSIIDISNPDALHTRSTYTATGVTDGDIDQGYYYLGRMGNQLEILDVRSPDAPKLVANITASASLGAMYIANGFAFIGTYIGKIYQYAIYNVYNPTQPQLVGLMNTRERIAALQGSLVYMHVLEGLEIIDITTISQPRIRGVWHNAFSIGNMISDGKYSYTVGEITTGESGLQVIDASNPQKPVVKGTWQGPFGHYFLTAGSGMVASVGGIPSSDLYFIDVHDPTRPTLAATIHVSDRISAVKLYNGYAYIYVSYYLGLQTPYSKVLVLDLQHLDAPPEQNGFDVSGWGSLTIGGDKLYVSNPSDTSVYDLADPAHPAYVEGSHIEGRVLKANDSTAYTYSDVNHTLTALDISEERAYISRSAIQLPSIDDYAFNSTTGYFRVDETLYAVDTSNSSNLHVSGTYVVPDLSSVAANDSFVYIGSGADGLWVLNAIPPQAAASQLTGLAVGVANEAPSASNGMNRSASAPKADHTTHGFAAYPNAWLTITTLGADGKPFPFAGRIYLLTPPDVLLPSSVELVASDNGRKSVRVVLPSDRSFTIVAMEGSTGIGTSVQVQIESYDSFVPMARVKR